MKIISLKFRGFGRGKESKFGDVKKICFEKKPTILALQETNCHLHNDNYFFALWGSMDCRFCQKDIVGKSGGQMLIWDNTQLVANSELISDLFIAIRGHWKQSGEESIIVNIYGPHENANKKKMWEALEKLMSLSGVSWVLSGDFNEVRDAFERFNCEFISSRARRFNEFISRNRLVEIPLGCRKFTRVSDDGIKMSKLDRFLVSDDFLITWPDLKVNALDRFFSDHCPIVLLDIEVNFGLKPFKIFNESFQVKGIDEVISKSWEVELVGNKKDCVFRNKLKRLKLDLKKWSIEHFGGLDGEINDVKKVAMDLKLKVEQGCLSNLEHSKWLEGRKIWIEKEMVKSNMLKQKTRVKWMTEGDENSKYFHHVMRRKYSKNNIRGMIVNEIWCQ
ncbi:uncharacterized protein [Rutidosis leptorrhynchoides]|uniref:uncharacterized protein n=1 Tax=Rutidosis leptorrhynchoides TaxID=125765 RepID=UPI003A98E278